MKLILLILMMATAAFADGEAFRKDTIALGGKEGHGGDAVLCTASNKNSYNGLYVLDYVIANERNPRNLRDLGSADFEIKAIYDQLERKIPQLFESFKEYINAYHNANSQKRTSKHYWQSQPNGLFEIHDENLQEKLPENCQKIFQTVIWITRQDQFIYKYDPKVFAQLVAQGQLSWIFVHEWLRGFVVDAGVIRDVNEYLHSKDLVTDTEDEVAQTLSVLQMGNFKTQKMVNDDNEMIKVVKDLLDTGYAVFHSPCTEENMRKARSLYTTLGILNDTNTFFDQAMKNKTLYSLRDQMRNLEYTLQMRSGTCRFEIVNAAQKAGRSIDELKLD
jgi:hypothetical protein